MRSRLEGALKVVLLVVGAGLLVSVAAFAVTAGTPGYRYIGPICVDNVARPGFDPWSGQPHGRIVDQYRCPPRPPSARLDVTRIVYPPPNELVGRTAVPLPVGFAVGCLAMTGVLGARSVRRRLTPASLVTA